MIEPACSCPMQRYGAIDHHANCAWMAWKKQPLQVVCSKPEMPTVSNLQQTASRVVLLNLRICSFEYKLPGYRSNYPRLLKSVKLTGRVLIPITVKRLGNCQYEIIDGVLRYQAAVEAGLDTICAILTT